MAQTKEFYQNHGEKGIRFKRLIVDKGLLDKNIGFPIDQIDNDDLYQKYRALIMLKRAIQKVIKRDGFTTQFLNDLYMFTLHDYKSKLAQYHKPRF